MSLRYVDAGVIETHREIGRALAGRDHGAAGELLERDVPEPRRVAAVGSARVDRDHDRAAACRGAGRRSRRGSRPNRPGSWRAGRSRRGRRRDGARSGPRPRAPGPSRRARPAVDTPSARAAPIAIATLPRLARPGSASTNGCSTPSTRNADPRRLDRRLRTRERTLRARPRRGGAREERAARRARGRVAVPLGAARDPRDVGRGARGPHDERIVDVGDHVHARVRGERVAPAQREHARLGVAVELIAAQIQQRGDRVGAASSAAGRYDSSTSSTTGPVPAPTSRRRAAC